uniref:Uncharacterized protein n=1 Tax=Anguilla anguilla TaxID=7936 RepID=A0A0E9VFL8_ANGAN
MTPRFHYPPPIVRTKRMPSYISASCMCMELFHLRI